MFGLDEIKINRIAYINFVGKTKNDRLRDGVHARLVTFDTLDKNLYIGMVLFLCA